MLPHTRRRATASFRSRAVGPRPAAGVESVGRIHWCCRIAELLSERQRADIVPVRPTVINRSLVATAMVAAVAGVVVLDASVGGNDSMRQERGSSPPDEGATRTDGAVADETASSQSGRELQSHRARRRKPRIDPRASTLAPSSGCELVKVRVHGKAPRIASKEAPPVPRLQAHRDGGTILVTYRFVAMPQACRPVAMVVTANSVDKVGNVSSASPDGGPIAVKGGTGTVKVPVPPYGRPPYEARAMALTREGLRAPLTTVGVR